MARSLHFADRSEAGRALANELRKLELDDPVVLALPRGGVPVAVEVARTLVAPLDLVFVRKIGLPHMSEVAAAAVVDGGKPVRVVNDDVVTRSGISKDYIDAHERIELAEIQRRRRKYLGDRPHVALRGRDLVVVDDGIATGASMRAALVALDRKAPRKLIVAVPIASPEAIASLHDLADDIVCLLTPENFRSVGELYQDFHQLGDDEVMAILAKMDRRENPPAAPNFENT